MVTRLLQACTLALRSTQLKTRLWRFRQSVLKGSLSWLARRPSATTPISDHPKPCNPLKQWPVFFTAGRAMPHKLCRAAVHDRTRRDQLHQERHHRLT